MPGMNQVPTRIRPSTIPPIYVDATTALGYLDSGTQLLAAGTTKQFRVRRSVLEQARNNADQTVPVYVGTPQVLVGFAPPLAIAGGVSTVYKQAVANGVLITNRSGYDAEITLQVSNMQDGGGPRITEAPIYVPNGATMEIKDLAIVGVAEKNLGAGAQTGRGVCYLFYVQSVIG